MIIIMGEFDVVVGAGTLRSTAADVVQFPHRWNPGRGDGGDGIHRRAFAAPRCRRLRAQ